MAACFQGRRRARRVAVRTGRVKILNRFDQHANRWVVLAIVPV
jgi:hypothetical protein